MIVALLCFVSFSLAQPLTFFTQPQTGDGTYYGGNIAGGACSLYPLPSFANPGGSLSTNQVNLIALNEGQFAGSLSCGMCLQMSGTGTGSGANPIGQNIYAVVTDICPGCPSGLIDLGYTGDGKWGITWKAVDCPTIGGLQYMFQGSNPYYIKLQVRNHKIPVQSVEFKTPTGTYVAGQRSSDNFFIMSSGYPFPLTISVTNPLELRITSINGEVITDAITSLESNNNVVLNGKNNIQFVGISAAPSQPSAPTVPTVPTDASVPTDAPTGASLHFITLWVVILSAFILLVL